MALPTIPTGLVIGNRERSYVTNDLNIYPCSPIPEPSKGIPFVDPVYGSELVKIVDSGDDLQCAHSYAGWCRHDAENCDETMIWVQSYKYPVRHVFRSVPPYSFICDLPWESHDPDWRWDISNPNILRGTIGSSFVQFDVSTQQLTTIRDFQTDFPSLPIFRVIAKEGGNPSFDGRYWCWVVRCYSESHSPMWWDDTIFVYDMLENSIVASCPGGGHFIGMSPQGDYALVDVKAYPEYHNVYVYPRNLTSNLCIRMEIGVHAFPGVGLDDEGRQVLVWVEQYGALGYWVAMADLETGTKHYLAPFGSSPLFNASAVNFSRPGWAAVCCNDTDQNNWASRQIMMVELSRRISNPNMNDHTMIWRVCDTRVKILDHADEIFCKTNRQGTKIYFRSGWGKSVTEQGGEVNTYRINLPETWDTDILKPVPIYKANDKTFYPVTAIDRPPKGGSYTDPLNGLTVTRITDATVDLPAGASLYLHSGYPKHNIENADKTKLILQAFYSSCWFIWNAKPPYGMDHEISYNLIRWGRPIDFRWDNVDPNIGYYTLDNRLMQYNIVTREATIIHDFGPDIATMFPPIPGVLASLDLTMAEEGEASDDRRYWAFLGIGYDGGSHWWPYCTVVYDKTSDTIVASIKDGDQNYVAGGDVSVSPSGKFVVYGNQAIICPPDLSTSFIPKVHAGHSDLAISAEGREVVATTNWLNTHAAMVDLETGIITQLAELPKARDGYHVSANSHKRPGWALFSFYAPSAGVPEAEWGDHEAILYELTTRTDPPPRIIRIAQTRTKWVQYNDVSFAKLNVDGTAIYFISGWGKSTEDGGCFDVYRVDIPSELYQAS